MRAQNMNSLHRVFGSGWGDLNGVTMRASQGGNDETVCAVSDGRGCFAGRAVMWTKSWTIAFPLKREPDYGMFEYACHEGNYGLRNILSGSRAGEAAGRP